MESKVLLPKIRFPEFRETAEWEDRPFRDLYNFAPTNSFSRDQLNYSSGTVKNIHYGDIHTRFQALFDIRKELVPYVNSAELPNGANSAALCAVGDMIFADASEDIDDVGKSIEVVNLDDQQLVSGTHTILAKRKEADLIVGFGGHLFLTSRIRSQIRRESQGAKIFGLSPMRLAAIGVCYPAHPAEQKKIADCLTSVDDLLAAEVLKLDTLRAFKKGLMQNLFPHEGETTPRLRFPEFRNVGEWEEKALRKVCSVNPPSKGLPESFVYIDLESVVAGELVKRNRIKRQGAPSRAQRLLEPEDVIFQTVRPYQRNNLLVAFEEEGPLVASTGYAQLRAFGNKQFLYQVMHHDPVVDKVIAKCSGSNYPAINSSDLAEIPLPVPPTETEQKRIASCLVSLDALITAQARLLDALRTHKQGLMQNLFPPPEAA